MPLQTNYFRRLQNIPLSPKKEEFKPITDFETRVKICLCSINAKVLEKLTFITELQCSSRVLSEETEAKEREYLLYSNPRNHPLILNQYSKEIVKIVSEIDIIKLKVEKTFLDYDKYLNFKQKIDRKKDKLYEKHSIKRIKSLLESIKLLNKSFKTSRSRQLSLEVYYTSKMDLKLYLNQALFLHIDSINVDKTQREYQTLVTNYLAVYSSINKVRKAFEKAKEITKNIKKLIDETKNYNRDLKGKLLSENMENFPEKTSYVNHDRIRIKETPALEDITLKHANNGQENSETLYNFYDRTFGDLIFANLGNILFANPDEED